MCTCVHISVTKWCVVGDLPDALYNLWDRFIVSISTALHCITRLWVNGEGYFSGYFFIQSTMWLWISNISRCMLSNALANKYWFREHIFSCDQAALWMVQSVRLSVRHTFLIMFLSSYHHEIFRSYYQWQKWRPCKRSRSEVIGQGHRGHNPT